MIRAMVIGHSHIGALLGASRQTNHPIRIAEHILLHRAAEKYGRLWKPEIFGHEFLAGKLKKDVTTGARKSNCLIISLGGNAHNLIGLYKHTRPYDFVLTEQPKLPFLDHVEAVPEELVRAAISERYKRWARRMKTFVKIARIPTFHPESPPPIADASFIKKTDKQTCSLDVAPVSLRYKLWRLHSQLVRFACSEAGVEFLAAPLEATDDNGYLLQRFWGQNGTHANRNYGDMVLEQVANRLDCSG